MLRRLQACRHFQALLDQTSQAFKHSVPSAVAATFILIAIGAQSVSAADLNEAKRLFKSGAYQACLAECEEPVANGIWNEEWYRLKIRVELILGRYADAETTLQLGMDKYKASIYLRLLGHEVLQMNDRPDEASAMLMSIDETVREYPWRFSDARNRLVVGRFMLMSGGDPKDVLNSFYDKAKDLSPRLVDSYIAAAELALDKYDFELASLEAQAALVIDEEDPMAHYLLAKAFAPTDRERANAELQRTLELNPNLTEALLWSADMAIDSEYYEQAEETLLHVEAINSKLPELWAYRAVLAHLDGDYELEQQHRGKALEPYSTNPFVDYLIGKKLSQKYRFAEGAAYQRQALEFDSEFLPSKFQLSQDLLRLGDEEQGWALAQQVNALDNYNVVAHNLVTLKDQIDRFVTLERDNIHIRMSTLESELYGDRALTLMSEAKQELSERYQITIDEPVIIEIFPEQKDFAIRTFGLPGGQGFLGVCFGRVITANSPASQGSHPSNWEATLWHEFCHVVTLEKTNNRMPRWLSEGISVFEERRKGPGWGQTMNSRYRQMIIDGEMTPVSELSGAFLRPPSGMHLQFAYFQSSLVVEYLVDEYGLEIVQNILTDLGVGMPINDSISRYVGSIERFDAEFETYARTLADQLANDGDWASANVGELASSEELTEWLDSNPNNLAALRRLAAEQMRTRDWTVAIETLEKLIALYDGVVDVEQDHIWLAHAYREKADHENEARVLLHFVSRVADNSDAHRRLLELARERSDWQDVNEQAQRLLAIDPLQAEPHLALAESAMNLDRPREAITAYRALLMFRTTDIADVYFRLARLHAELEEWDAAHYSILNCLAEAPRYREAYVFYREIVGHLDGKEER